MRFGSNGRCLFYAFHHNILCAALLTGMDGYKLLTSTATSIASSGTVKSCKISDN